MDQDSLNRARMDEWESSDCYEAKFRLKLTSKHELVVGKWQAEGAWGVDLRRWSYDLSRLLGAGVTIDAGTWQRLYDVICNLHERGLFAQHGRADRQAFNTETKIDRVYSLVTEVFDEGRVPYFCVGLRKHGEIVWRARGTPIGIIIRFDTIADFITQAQSTGLAPRREKPKGNKDIDRSTGREIF